MTVRPGAPAHAFEIEHHGSPRGEAHDTLGSDWALIPFEDETNELDEPLSMGLDCFEVDSF
ncbi:MAG: hypothetical protein IPI67_33085 [Myxococcales bacterium]|nr:hypothetical protein [Myxococcales bacterium]